MLVSLAHRYFQKKMKSVSGYALGLIFIFSLCNPFFILAKTNSDSLHRVLYENSDLSNIEKLDQAKLLSDLYINTDLNNSLECELAVYYYSKIINNDELIIESLKNISYFQNRLYDYSASDTSLHILYNYLLKLDNKDDIANVLYRIASNYYDWNDYKRAKENYEKAKGYFVLTGNKQGIAKCMKGSAIVVSSWGDYEMAIGLLQNARDIYSEIQDDEGLAEVYLALGVMMQEWHKLDRALDYFDKALEYYSGQEKTLNVVNVFLHIGDIYLLREDCLLALNTYRDAQRLELKVDHKKLRSIVLSNIGEAYYCLNELDSALIFQRRALVLKEEVGDEKRLAVSYLNLGDIYFKKGMNDSSVYYLKKTLLLSKKVGYRDIELDAMKSLSELYKSANNLSMAFKFLDEYIELEQHTFSEETNKLVEEFEIKYEVKKRDTENEILKHKNSIQLLQIEKEKNTKIFTIIFASFVVFIAFIIVFFVNYRIRESRKNLSIQSFKNKEITRQKEELSTLNTELALSREKFKGIVENATIGIYQTSPEGKVLFANKNLIHTLGFEDFESLASTDLNVDHPDRNSFLSDLGKNDLVTGREDIWKKANGDKMYVVESAWAVKNSDGSVRYIEGLVEDISRRKYAEIQLKKSQMILKKTNSTLLLKNEQLEKAKRETEEAYNTKSSFLANVSHEIRTPMNAIIGFTELLLSLENDPKMLSYIKAIDSSSKSLLSLINDILDLSKIQSGNQDLIFEATSVRTIVTEVEHIFSLQVKKKKIELLTNIDESFPKYINIDGVRIKQVLFNVIGNAIKFTDKGFVSVSISSIVQKLKNDYIDIEIVVIDSGPGISKSEQDTIFSAFSQSKNIFNKSYSGTGLGLSITKQIVELMDGTLALESDVDKGSKFIISIPNIKILKVRNSLSSGGDGSSIVAMKKDKVLIIPDDSDFSLEVLDKPTIEEIRTQFNFLFKRIETYKMVEDIVLFANGLLKLGKSNNNTGLIEVATKLLDATDRFEIEDMESILSTLKVIFENK